MTCVFLQQKPFIFLLNKVSKDFLKYNCIWAVNQEGVAIRRSPPPPGSQVFGRVLEFQDTLGQATAP